MDPKWIGILKSRKFWASVIGLVFVVLAAYVPPERLPFTQDEVLNFTMIVVGYVLSIALEDGLRAARS